ncbi:ABC transporter substrate-binding protein [Vallicoccus soli]|uniref:Fe/B12 periplasmic-binding domain-containing protein n=1 Tax=Vallicoccus soli TaxID=2339232 RepID=A0A3A3Z3R7_9ACTN|nr:ABC transporter substrate-binding protein [Vallicoccus soli]RJK97548.1 hypothetical protein D5H78_00465 [Vallicoccus soli]
MPSSLPRRTVLAAGAALLVGACSQEQAGRRTTGGRAAGGAFPRTVEHERGATEVPAAPRRVVAVTDGAELASLLALGVRPVGFGQRTDPLQPWTQEGLGQVGGQVPTYDLSSGEVDLEQLAAWRPDLLLVQDGFDADGMFERLSALAPTVTTSFIDWRRSVRQVADAVGRPEDGGRLVSRTEAVARSARGRLSPYRGARLAMVVSFASGEDFLLNAASPVGKLAPALGLAPFPASRTPGEAVEQVSAELLGDALEGADLVAVLAFEDGDPALARVVERPELAGVPAVAAGRVAALSVEESNGAYFDSVLTVPRNVALLERLARLGA